MGFVSVLVVFIYDLRGVQTLIVYVVSSGLVIGGQKLFQGNTTENWLQASYSSLVKNVVGGVLLILGWVLFLRGVISIAVAALVLKFS